MNEERNEHASQALSEGAEPVDQESRDGAHDSRVVPETDQEWVQAPKSTDIMNDSLSCNESALELEIKPRPPLRSGPGKGRRLVHKEAKPAAVLTSTQRLVLLDTWRRSQLPAADFATLVGVRKHSLYGWKKRFGEQEPAGLGAGVRSGRLNSWRAASKPPGPPWALLLMRSEENRAKSAI